MACHHTEKQPGEIMSKESTKHGDNTETTVPSKMNEHPTKTDVQVSNSVEAPSDANDAHLIEDTVVSTYVTKSTKEQNTVTDNREEYDLKCEKQLKALSDISNHLDNVSMADTDNRLRGHNDDTPSAEAIKDPREDICTTNTSEMSHEKMKILEQLKGIGVKEPAVDVKIISPARSARKEPGVPGTNLVVTGCGTVSIAVAVVSIMSNIVAIMFEASGSVISYGIWGGVVFATQGAFTLAMAYSKRRAIYITVLVLSILAALISIMVMLFAAYGVRSEPKWSYWELIREFIVLLLSDILKLTFSWAGQINVHSWFKIFTKEAKVQEHYHLRVGLNTLIMTMGWVMLTVSVFIAVYAGYLIKMSRPIKESKRNPSKTQNNVLKEKDKEKKLQTHFKQKIINEPSESIWKPN